MTDIRKLISRRGVLKAQLTRFNTFLNAFENKQTSEQASSLQQLQARLDTITSIYSEYDNVQSEIEFLSPDDEIDVNNEDRSEFETKYFDSVARAKKCLSNVEISNESQSVASTGIPQSTSIGHNPFDITHSNVKLPQIILPEFSGSYERWSQFHDTFDALINKNTTLSKIQKYYYLQASLKADAAQVISSLSVSDTNYEVAWKLLKDRFQNTKAIISSHIRGIVELPNNIKDSYESLRVFLDTFLKHYRALEKLEPDSKYWDTLLIYLLISKLDINSRKDWERYIKDNGSPKIDDFTKFLSERCNLLEAVDVKGNNKQIYSNAVNKKSHEMKQGIRTLTHVTTNKISCILCQGSHYLFSCKKFLDMPVSTRYSEVKRLKLCTNCLRLGHANFECRNSSSCKTCLKRHNSLLHFPSSNSSSRQSITRDDEVGSLLDNSISQAEKSNNNDQTKLQPSVSNFAQNNYSLNSQKKFSHSNSFIFLPTAIVNVCNSNNQYVQCRALLDSGSQSNFATSDLIQRLNLHSSSINLHIFGINQCSTNIKKQTNVELKSLFTDYRTSLSCLIIDRITDTIPQRKVNIQEFKIPDNITMADPHFYEPGNIDLLLGASIFFELLCVGQIKLGKDLPSLQETKLGWIVAGRMFIPQKNQQSSCFTVTNSELQDQLERFWQVDENFPHVKYSKEEDECEEHFVKNYSRDDSGRLIVKLPLKNDISVLGNSLEMSIRRFHSMEKRFAHNFNLKNEYSKFIKEYESLGHMIRINFDCNLKKNCYYLPHHSVEKVDSLTTKLRVVFDASSKTSSGLSLNDVLKVGPSIQSDLFSIIVRFRQHNVVLIGDLTKMYRQIKVHSSQRDFQRIVWRDSPEEELSHFQLQTVTYGMAPSSFLATRCLKQVALDNQTSYAKESKIILSDFYMDDVLTGSHDIESVISIRKNLTKILGEACFELRKFSSNEPRVLCDLKDNHQNISYLITDNEHTKALGIFWNASADEFVYHVKKYDLLNTISKRTILSYVSKIFDPLGLLGPITIQAKIILQKLWQCNIDWDEPIPSDLYTSWIKFYSKLSEMDTIRIPRQVICRGASKIQIHGFCDASEYSYAAAIYIRSKNENYMDVRLLCAKSRVAPLKSISIARLELCGALLLARLKTKITSELNELPIEDIYYWTDSTIVLSWLSAEPFTWKTFVCNRVSEIQKLTQLEKWHHIRTADNPADIISRGIEPTELSKSTLWWHGPSFLTLDYEYWPENSHISNFSRKHSDLLEFKRKASTYSCTLSFNLFDSYSSFTKLQRVVAYCLRFSRNCKSTPEGRQNGILTIDELSNSTNTLIYLVQAQAFSDDIKYLQSHGRVKSNSNIASLNPFIDKNNILRVGGRLKHSSLSFNQKHQILLPKHHKFTNLIIKYEHIHNFHSGPQATLSFIRQNYWPLNGKEAVKSIIRNCTICFKVKPISTTQQMGDLPDFRVKPSRIFSFCGVDYAGPFQIKDGKTRNRKLVKSYICLFICLASKAIHLELVSDLTSESFLNALKRFVSRRGICRKLFSDNGTNFTGANNELKKINGLLQNDRFQQYLSLQNIEWKFNPARSPHMGGLWEAVERSVKYYLKRVTKHVLFTYEEFYTILTQVEAILNSRPLIPLSNNPNDLEAITPGHFLIGEALNSLPQVDLEDTPFNYLSRYDHICKMSQQIWKRWSRDYLHSLQQRTKWRFRKENPALLVGALVLLKEDNMLPLHWHLGRITELHPGADGLVRVVSVKTKNGTLKRAVAKICLMPTD